MAKIKNVWETLRQMTNHDFLKSYFLYGGQLSRLGFINPFPSNRKNCLCYFSFLILANRASGRELLIDLYVQYLEGRVDKFGKVKN